MAACAVCGEPTMVSQYIRVKSLASPDQDHVFVGLEHEPEQVAEASAHLEQPVRLLWYAPRAGWLKRMEITVGREAAAAMRRDPQGREELQAIEAGRVAPDAEGGLELIEEDIAAAIREARWPAGEEYAPAQTDTGG